MKTSMFSHNIWDYWIWELWRLRVLIPWLFFGNFTPFTVCMSLSLVTSNLLIANLARWVAHGPMGIASRCRTEGTGFKTNHWTQLGPRVCETGYLSLFNEPLWRTGDFRDGTPLKGKSDCFTVLGVLPKWRHSGFSFPRFNPEFHCWNFVSWFRATRNLRTARFRRSY